MGKVRAYEKDPVVKAEVFDASTFSFKFIEIETVPGKVGWEKYKITLPAKIRAMYVNDVVYGADWAALVGDFDKKLPNQNLVLVVFALKLNPPHCKVITFTTMPSFISGCHPLVVTMLAVLTMLAEARFGLNPSTAIIAAPPEPEPAPAVAPWENEPTTVSELLELHVVEAKISGRDAGTTLFVVDARRRNGSLVDTTPNQSYKLFVVSCLH